MESKINLELKYRCKDFKTIREKLQELKVNKVGVFHQKDYFFNLPKKSLPARLKLRVQENKQCLIFYTRPDFSEDKSTPADVSLYNVKDDNLLDFLRTCLGVKAVVIKTRELWQKDNTIFNLDDVEGVGKIFEIEVGTNKEDKEKDEAIFQKYKKAFLPFLDEIVKGSNVDLVLSQ